MLSVFLAGMNSEIRAGVSHPLKLEYFSLSKASTRVFTNVVVGLHFFFMVRSMSR